LSGFRDARLALPEYSAPESFLFVTYLPNRHLSTKVRAFVDLLAARFQATPYWDNGLPVTAG
jgi:DNA-binding transcriptional LysR family regulator